LLALLALMPPPNIELPFIVRRCAVYMAYL
jgi:hypothetical protein